MYKYRYIENYNNKDLMLILNTWVHVKLYSHYSIIILIMRYKNLTYVNRIQNGFHHIPDSRI